MIKKVLSNGMKMIYYPMEHTHSIYLSLNILSGPFYETLHNNGISHLLEHIHFRQLGELNQKALYQKVNCMGSSLMAATDSEVMRFCMEIRPSYFRDCLHVFRDIIRTCHWSEDQLNSEKQVVLNQIYEAQSYLSVYDYSNKLIWKRHPYSKKVIGTEENIKKISLQQLIDYKNQRFRSGNICMICAGNLSQDQIDFSNGLFSAMQIPASAEERYVIKNPQFHRKPDVKLVHVNWDMAELLLSFDIDIKKLESEEVVLLNSILGDGDGSVLSDSLKEDLGLVSDIYSYLEHYRDASLLHIRCSVYKDNMIPCLKAIMAGLNKMKQNITQEQYDANIVYHTDNLWFNEDSPKRMNASLSWDYFVHKKRYVPVEEQIDKFRCATTRSIMRAAQTIFQKTNLSLTLLGDLSSVKKDGIVHLFQDL